MARSQLRQRDKLVARAESVRASIAADVVAPLSLEIATLQAELRLAAAGVLRVRPESIDRRAPLARYGLDSLNAISLRCRSMNGGFSDV